MFLFEPLQAAQNVNLTDFEFSWRRLYVPESPEEDEDYIEEQQNRYLPLVQTLNYNKINFLQKKLELSVEAPSETNLHQEIKIEYTLTSHQTEEMEANYKIDDSAEFFVSGTTAQTLTLLPEVPTKVSVMALPLRVGRMKLPNLKLLVKETGKLILEHERATSILV